MISLSKEILNIENWQSSVQKMKDFQKEWKAIGFVPRKLDNKLWKEFSDIQKEYFNRLKSGYEHISPEKEILLNKKKSFLDKFIKFYSISIPANLSLACHCNTPISP